MAGTGIVTNDRSGAGDPARTLALLWRVQADSAMSDEQWWEANAPFLAPVFDKTKHPTAARVGTAAGAAHRGADNPTHAYEFGLQRVLDGLGVLIERRQGHST